jgi:uncharacterized protein YbjT (DUF2867 family)
VKTVFVTGGTGYLGRPLIAALLARGHEVHALARPGSVAKLPSGAVPVAGNALDESTFASRIPPGASLVHLVGTPHPNPAKGAEFRRIDLPSILASVAAAQRAALHHLIYVSVAHPAPIMQDYIAVRQQGEAAIRASGIPATILRPWYVLGPGHYWPYALIPVYAALRLMPGTRESAERLGLVTHRQMVAALLGAVESGPSAGVRVLGVPEIKAAGSFALEPL